MIFENFNKNERIQMKKRLTAEDALELHERGEMQWHQRKRHSSGKQHHAPQDRRSRTAATRRAAQQMLDASWHSEWKGR
jgi:hypothetical protein